MEQKVRRRLSAPLVVCLTKIAKNVRQRCSKKKSDNLLIYDGTAVYIEQANMKKLKDKKDTLISTFRFLWLTYVRISYNHRLRGTPATLTWTIVRRTKRRLLTDRAATQRGLC